MARLTAIAALALMLPAAAWAQPEDGEADGDDAAETADGDAEDKAAAAEPPPADADDVDLDALRKEYMRLRDLLFRSRARAAAVGDALYSTRLVVHLDYSTARFYSVGRAAIRLDGASVYDDVQGQIAEDKAPRFEGFIAPGRHLITVRVEATGKDDDRFTSVIENTFTIQAPAGHDVTVKVKAADGGTIPYNWKKKKSGSYKLRLDATVKAKKRKGESGTKAAKGAKAGTKG